jgi:hypothetical protein
MTQFALDQERLNNERKDAIEKPAAKPAAVPQQLATTEAF